MLGTFFFMDVLSKTSVADMKCRSLSYYALIIKEHPIPVTLITLRSH